MRTSLLAVLEYAIAEASSFMLNMLVVHVFVIAPSGNECSAKPANVSHVPVDVHT